MERSIYAVVGVSDRSDPSRAPIGERPDIGRPVVILEFFASSDLQYASDEITELVDGTGTVCRHRVP